MTNTLYLDPGFVTSVEKLSSSQQRLVFAALQSVSEDVDGNSSPLCTSTTVQRRVSHAGNLRILLQYHPAQQKVLVTGISPGALAEELFAGTPLTSSTGLLQ
jgi:hypothetical protein